MSIEQHPGYLGWTSRGVIAIHADWPAYAIAHGHEYAMERLGAFPLGTRFRAIDDIDQCLLLLAEGAGLKRDPRKHDFDESLFHLALWHEDVVSLVDQGWLDGVGLITHREWARRRFEGLRGCFYELPDGRRVPVPLPDLASFEDEVATVPAVSEAGMSITQAGVGAVESMMSAQRGHIAPRLAEHVEPLISIARFDTAVREACVLLEDLLKKATKTKLYGIELVKRYVADLEREELLNAAHAKWIRAELRACFAFVRNDFMHNHRSISEVQCIALICRISSAYSEVLELQSSRDTAP